MKNKGKVILLVVLLVAVAVVFAVQSGVFSGGGSKPPPADPSAPKPEAGSHRVAPGANK